MSLTTVDAQSLPATGGLCFNMTIDEVDSMVTRRNLQLKSSQLDIVAAEGELLQSRKYENPEVQLMHNIQNPVNKRWFDMGYDGETDVQISQGIAIGGQHAAKVRRATSLLDASRADYQKTLIDTRYDARTVFIDLYNVQQKLKVYDQEILSVEKIYKAYSEQTGKGNVSRIQTFRIATMLSQLRSEKAELQLCENDLQKELHLILNMKGEAPIEAKMDEAAIVDRVIENLTKLQPLVAQLDQASLSAMLQNHPSIAQAMYMEESACHALKAEKADALPHITLNGEWDKNGSIGHNFFAIGATVSVPLWNRNQSNIRAAKAQYAQASLDREKKENELKTSLLTNYRNTIMQLELVEDQKKQLSADLDQLLDAAEEQIMKRNISVMEFVDLYGSYRKTKFQMMDAKVQLMKAGEGLKSLTPEPLSDWRGE